MEVNRMNFSVEELLMSAVLLYEDEAKPTGRKWVHPSLLCRAMEGEFHTLFPQLLDDETKFFQYFRMSREPFRNTAFENWE
jgi:hypothetical protein